MTSWGVPCSLIAKWAMSYLLTAGAGINVTTFRDTGAIGAFKERDRRGAQTPIPEYYQLPPCLSVLGYLLFSINGENKIPEASLLSWAV